MLPVDSAPGSTPASVRAAITAAIFSFTLAWVLITSGPVSRTPRLTVARSAATCTTPTPCTVRVRPSAIAHAPSSIASANTIAKPFFMFLTFFRLLDGNGKPRRYSFDGV